MNILFLCFKIFLARILDVSLGTFRTIITIKEHSLYASIIGFIEVLIWFLIVKEALNTNETSIFIAISYALGFASGTYIGSKLSNKFIKSKLNIQIILNKNKEKIVKVLRNKGFAVTILNLEEKNKYMLFIEISNTKLNHLYDLVKSYDEKAFIVVNETKYVINGYFQK